MVKVKMFEATDENSRPSMDAPKTDAKAFHDIVNSRRRCRLPFGIRNGTKLPFRVRIRT